ncbi:hypothetical protein BAV1621 [Bordetella avium 197N]|uniref:Uncharacterized protein n=1 Tax=Bordetella avium (strain 197N) TaxID=360910 RepID=Q2L1L8_BORA1|nr:hypothetical protein BAV1621 [Bordetella avium 197N]
MPELSHLLGCAPVCLGMVLAPGDRVARSRSQGLLRYAGWRCTHAAEAAGQAKCDNRRLSPARTENCFDPHRRRFA